MQILFFILRAWAIFCLVTMVFGQLITTPIDEWDSELIATDEAFRVMFLYVPLAILAQWWLQDTKLTDVIEMILPKGRNRNPRPPARASQRDIALPPLVTHGTIKTSPARSAIGADLQDYLNEGRAQQATEAARDQDWP